MRGYRPFYGQGDGAYETTAASKSAADKAPVEWPDPPPGVEFDAADSVSALRRVCDYIEVVRGRTVDWRVGVSGWVVSVSDEYGGIRISADSAARRSSPLGGEFALIAVVGIWSVRATGDSWTDLTRRVLGRLAASGAVSPT